MFRTFVLSRRYRTNKHHCPLGQKAMKYQQPSVYMPDCVSAVLACWPNNFHRLLRTSAPSDSSPPLSSAVNCCRSITASINHIHYTIIRAISDAARAAFRKKKKIKAQKQDCCCGSCKRRKTWVKLCKVVIKRFSTRNTSKTYIIINQFLFSFCSLPYHGL